MEFNIKPPAKNELIEKLTGYNGKIYFGVPEDTSSMRSEWLDSKHISKRKVNNPSPDNAYILAIMEHGSPVKNIPPRPLLKPVIKKHREQIQNIFERIYKLLLEGDETGADFEMERLSQRIQRWTQEFFVEDNGWAPNSPATIKRKGSDKPLIDTASLRGSIRGVFIKNRRK